jgi:superfamily I DNA/RNA helicase
MATTSTRSWSSQQEAIFTFFEKGKGNLVVGARAGTGKTTTIIEALSHAKAERRILLAAFNKRIATELQGRITAPNAEAKTLHALGFSFLRARNKNITVDAAVDRERAAAACRANFDGPASDEIIFIVEKLASLLKSVMPFEESIPEVSDLANSFDLAPGEEDEEYGWTSDHLAGAAIAARDAAMKKDERGRISFDDMIFIPLACGLVEPKYSMVVVDEAQDMNFAQLLLAQRCCEKKGRIVVVGDDCQAIYGFRGADADGLGRLKTELKAKELRLTTTYRCAKSIVKMAQKFVPDFYAAETNIDGVVDGLTRDGMVEAAKPGDFVLSRKNAPLMSVCLGFLRQGKKARIEGRDVAAGMKKVIKNFDVDTVPAFIEHVGEWETKQIEKAVKIQNEDTRERKLAEISDKALTLVALAEDCDTVEAILARVDSLFGDGVQMDSDTIVCSSVHRAKGLESDRVFVLANTVSAKGREEKNIFYVAITRAKNHLTMVTA